MTNEEKFKKGLKEFLEGWNVTLNEISDHKNDKIIQSLEEFEIDFEKLFSSIRV